MVVCKFFQQGNCKFGARCNFEHPRNLQISGNQFANNSRAFGTTPVANSNQPTTTDITTDTLKTDLTTDKPQWPFTSYCPVKFGHSNLIKDQDLSPEEVRSGAYEALQKQSMPQYEHDLSMRVTNINTMSQNILSNLGEAVKAAQRDNAGSPAATSQSIATSGTNQINGAFGSTSQSVFGTASSSVFGQPNQNSSTVSQFGQSKSQPSSVFGATSGSSQSSPMFGATSKLPSAFGVAALTTPSAFGASMPSAGSFGSPTNATSPFNSTSTPQSVFGTSSFGNAGNVTSPFGVSAKPDANANNTGMRTTLQPASVFGQAQALGTFGTTSSAPSSAFASQAGNTTSPLSTGKSSTGIGNANPFAPLSQSSFGSRLVTAQPDSTLQTATSAQTETTKSAFGNTNTPQSAFGQTQAPQSAFAQKNSPQAAFGQASSPQSTFGKINNVQPAFGQPSNPQSAFGQTDKSQSAFGQTSSPQSAFGQANVPQPGFGQTSNSQSAFGQPKVPNSGSNQTSQQNAISVHTGNAVSAFGQNSSQSLFGRSSVTPLSQSNPMTPQGLSKPDQATSSQFSQESSLPGASAFGVARAAVISSPNLDEVARQPPSTVPALAASAKDQHSNQLRPASTNELSIEQIPEEILEKFKAVSFVIGQIPEIAPPIVLC